MGKKLIFVKFNGFTITTKGGLNVRNGEILFDGKKVEIDDKQPLLSKNFDSWVEVEMPDKVEWYERQSKTLHYTSEDGKQLTNEEYTERLGQLDLRGDTTAFPDIDSEYAYYKFKQKYQPVREEVTIDRTDELELIIHDFSKSGYIQITPLPVSNKKLLEGRGNVWVYEESMVGLFIETGLRLGFERINSYQDTKGRKFRTPDHRDDDLKYCQINGKYMNDNLDRRLTRSFLGTYEQCVEKLNQNRETIAKLYTDVIFLLDNRDIDRESVYHSIQSIRSSVIGLSVKVKSGGSKRGLIDRIDELLENLTTPAD
jgi:hypothetical protein